MLKVTVYLNRVKTDCKTNFVKAQEYFKKHGIDFEFDFKETDIKNLTWKKYNLVPQGERVLLDYVQLPYDNAEISMFCFDGGEFEPPNIPTGQCHYFNKPVIYISTHLLNPVGLEETEICHELMHALVYIARSKGFLVNDVLDSYRLNDQKDNPLSNFSEQWGLLAIWLKTLKIEPYEAFLTRGYKTQKQVVGTLMAKNKTSKAYFQTIELPWLENQINISCIPVGRYLCKYTYSPKFQKYTYQIMNVPNRTGIRIHSANFSSQLLGCIALGTELNYIDNDNELDTKNSGEAVALLENFMDRKDFYLNINDYKY